MSNPSPSPACKAAIRDADKAWPERAVVFVNDRERDKREMSKARATYGIMGDQAHLDRCTKEGKCEGHVIGNAVDITHDPEKGADGNLIAELAITDPRTAYVIWNKKIWSVKTGAWNAYTGANPHTAHVHISIKPELRDDDSAWPWAESGSGAGGRFRPSKLVIAPVATAAVVASYYFIKNWIR